MIYFDNAACAYPLPASVIDAVTAALRDGPGNGGGAYRASVRVREVIEAARADVASLVRAAHADRIVFFPAATNALHAVIEALPAGGNVVTTPLEHDATLRALGRPGEVRMAVPDERFRVDVSALGALMDEQTRLVALHHVSHLLGVEQDVVAAAALCRERGVPLLVDASQSVGILTIDVGAWGADFVLFSGHQHLYGPPGVGVLCVREDRALPSRVGMDEVSAAALAGLRAGVAHVNGRGMARVRQHHFNLSRRLLAQLVTLKGVEVLNVAPDVGLVTFLLQGFPSCDVARVLDETHGFAVGSGRMEADAAHRHLGTSADGAVRVSVGLFNTEAEVDALAAAVESITGGRM